MKVLVQQPTTGLFFKGTQQWVADPSEALEFHDTLQAFDFCANHSTHEAQILLFTNTTSTSVSIKPSYPTSAPA